MKSLSLLLLAALFLSNAAWSAPAGLYEVELPVADQTTATRATALVEALRMAVVKVSGRSIAADSAVVKAALRNPARHVQRYSYRANNGAAAAELPLLLGVTFEQRGIDQLLDEAGLSVWSATRPLTIVWLAVEQGRQRILVGASDRGLVKELLVSAAQKRGLPLRLPLLDATDQARVQAGDIWSDFHESILQASQRYEAQAVLVGRLAPASAGRWQVRWSLYQDATTPQHWNQTGDTVETLIANGINSSTDSLVPAAGVSVPPVSGGDELHWVVTEVRDMYNHRRVMDYLASLRGLGSVQLVDVNSDSIRLRLTSNVDAEVLQQLAFDNRLLPLAIQAESSSSLVRSGDRVYRLAP
ncbi:MAG TPA: DUF2066 domain-containing protein [Gammaproteobacteria bacterium]